MYKIYCNIHYECNCVEEWVYGEYSELKDAVSVFFNIATGKVKLDFSGMAEAFGELIEQEYIGEDEVYGANVNLLRVAKTPEEWDQEMLSVLIEKDPYSEAITYNDVAVEGEMSKEEMELINSILYSA